MNPIKVGLIGLGQIGLGYDLNLGIDEGILTHFKAINNDSRFDLVFCVDPSPENLKKLPPSYKGKIFESISSIDGSSEIDLLVIASPTEYHLENIQEYLKKFKTKLILCEKPLSYSVSEAKTILELCESHGVKLLVNYIRRALPEVKEIFKEFSKVALDTTKSRTIVQYSKGFLHNGSHLLDLIFHFFPSQVQKVQILKFQKISEKDFLVDVKFEIGNLSLLMLSSSFLDLDLYEIEMQNKEIGIITYRDYGQDIQRYPSSNSSSNLTCIDYRKSISYSSNLNFYQKFVYMDVFNSLNENQTGLCTGIEASRLVEFADRIKKLGKESEI